LPPDVRVLTLGARGDLTVPANHTDIPGSFHRVLPIMGPDAHTELPGSAAVTREIGLTLAGLPPTCETLTDRLSDVAVGRSISWGESALGFVITSATG